ncbi:MAG TPA: metal-sulfur cluster assembly factor [Casimicrobiaceae bacterium]|nr:metal-sulfur cluster assembly factor [Casimicrobiaceae bacterium]
MSIADESMLHDALKTVEDPEAGMNIVDLGLVYAVDVTEDRVSVDMTMTTAACPMSDMIVEQVRDALIAASPSGTTVEVHLVWDPPWTPDRMSGLAKDHFGW